MPACQYIDSVLSWINDRLTSEAIFPTKVDAPFPPDFHMLIQQICKLMLRIFTHIYWAHFEQIVHLSLEAHWNSLFAHFICFVREFNLVDIRKGGELAPLYDLTVAFEQTVMNDNY